MADHKKVGNNCEYSDLEDNSGSEISKNEDSALVDEDDDYSNGEDKDCDEDKDEADRCNQGEDNQASTVKQFDVKKPTDICVKNQVFDMAFHPLNNYIATAEISGKVSLFSYSNDENKKLIEFKHHRKACRCVEFSPDGNKLYTCSRDKSVNVSDMNTGANIHSIAMAHKKPINKLKLLSENYMATGCDDGTVKVWDTRTFSTIAEFSNCKDYISDMDIDKEKRFLLCTSGDGFLSVYNLRKKKLEQASDQLDEELLSIAIVKNGQKVVCGSSEGTLNIYSWGEWGDISDRIPTNSCSIDSICRITDDIIITGSDDSCIRSMCIQPHKALGVVGKHGAFGIEHLKLSADRQYLASCAGENTVKFWNISHLYEESFEAEPQRKKARKRKMDETTTEKNNFFADL